MKYGGPDGELGASLRYISQRYSMPYREVSGLLTDIGSEATKMFHYYLIFNQGDIHNALFHLLITLLSLLDEVK